MKILLVGKSGQLGGDLLRNAGGHEIIAPGREELDVTVPASIDASIRTHRPEVVINTAAFHNVPRCEGEPEMAFRVNCVAVRDLAGACRASGALLVTFSTDYVFGGEKRTPYLEGDCPGPLQIYGITKLAGEHAALSTAAGQSIVIRTCGLYGASGAASKGGNFVDNRIRDAENEESLEMSCDQVVCPTSTDDLSRAVLSLITHPRLEPGIYHLVNEGECSWYEFTRSIYEIMGIEIPVKPVDRAGRDGRMRRPLYSVLANTKARSLGIVLPHWRDGLKRYLGNLHGPASFG
jgi:dTDP-4-dehydrorhamnose reductase